MINIYSYDKVEGVKFGATTTEAVAFFGTPKAWYTNNANEQVLDYTNFILRFDATSGLFREFTLLPITEGAINGVPVAWDKAFLLWLTAEDPGLVRVGGFIISRRLGVAVSGFHDGDESQKAIHAFNRGDWDMFAKKMVPFNFHQNQ